MKDLCINKKKCNNGTEKIVCANDENGKIIRDYYEKIEKQVNKGVRKMKETFNQTLEQLKQIPKPDINKVTLTFEG